MEIDKVTFDWQNFLEQFSGELLNNDEIRAHQPQEVLDSKWLGFAGASEDEIKSVESRLAIELPSSYRRFLQVSNGWRNCGKFINKIWSTNEIVWFKEHIPDWFETCFEPQSISDQEYFVYGKEQDPVNFRIEYVQTALEISDVGDTALYLLNPKIVTKNGEWEAWFFANWLPGANRYRSFQELIEAERQRFLEISK